MKTTEQIIKEIGEALKAALPILIEATENWSNGEDCYQDALDKVNEALGQIEN